MSEEHGFDIFVAIDLVGGRVVRLLRGDPEAATVYSDDPVATAVAWRERGATWLHVVDLEGALGGEAANAGVMRGIIEAVGVPVQVAGWQESSSLTIGEVLARLSGAGVARILFTDIGRDGTLEGPNLPAIRDVLAASDLGLIASGGVAGLADVETLLSLGDPHLEGVVVGKALYSGSLALEDALAVVASAAVGS